MNNNEIKIPYKTFIEIQKFIGYIDGFISYNENIDVKTRDKIIKKINTLDEILNGIEAGVKLQALPFFNLKNPIFNGIETEEETEIRKCVQKWMEFAEKIYKENHNHDWVYTRKDMPPNTYPKK